MLAFMPESLKAQETVRHELNIVLYPEEQRFTATDTVTVPESIIKERRFLLHGGLTPTSSTPGVQIVQYNRKEESVSTSSYRIILPPGKNSFVLQYGGRIYYPLESFGKERARGFKQTPGIISSEGVYLSGSSYWYPSFGEEMVTFTLQVELPSEWTAVSQGGRTLNSREKDSTIVRWESPEIQEEIFLVAAPFTEYRKIAGRSEAMVFLRTPDEKLASKYLEATVSYLALYENLIGTYPYRKFALVGRQAMGCLPLLSLDRRSSASHSSCALPILTKSSTTGWATVYFRITVRGTGQKVSPPIFQTISLKNRGIRE
jgi:hypothetical protein